MTISIREDGVWKQAEMFVKHSSSWTPVTVGYVKVEGVWEVFYRGLPAVFAFADAPPDGRQGDAPLGGYGTLQDGVGVDGGKYYRLQP